MTCDSLPGSVHTVPNFSGQASDVSEVATRCTINTPLTRRFHALSGQSRECRPEDALNCPGHAAKRLGNVQNEACMLGGGTARSGAAHDQSSPQLDARCRFLSRTAFGGTRDSIDRHVWTEQQKTSIPAGYFKPRRRLRQFSNASTKPETSVSSHLVAKLALT